MMWHFLLKNYKINLCNLIHNLVPIAINKGSHQTLERERERERVCSNGPGGEELKELGKSAGEDGWQQREIPREQQEGQCCCCYCWCWLCLLWDGMIPCPCAHLLHLWIPMEWNDFVYYEMTFVCLLCIQFNLFIFKSLKKKKKPLHF